MVDFRLASWRHKSLNTFVLVCRWAICFFALYESKNTSTTIPFALRRSSWQKNARHALRINANGFLAPFVFGELEKGTKDLLYCAKLWVFFFQTHGHPTTVSALPASLRGNSLTITSHFTYFGSKSFVSNFYDVQRTIVLVAYCFKCY